MTRWFHFYNDQTNNLQNISWFTSFQRKQERIMIPSWRYSKLYRFCRILLQWANTKQRNEPEAWVGSFIQIVVFCRPKPRVDVFAHRSLKAFAPADKVLRAPKGGSNFWVCELTRNSLLHGFIEKARKQCFLLVLLIMRHKWMDEILWFDHSNETSLAVLSHGAIYSVSI